MGITCFALLLTQTLHAQETPAATNSATAVTPFSVIYTGRLLGYFRYPDQQSLDRHECPQESEAEPEPATVAAIEREINSISHNQSRLLIGTGDNFSPELFARTFRPKAGTNLRLTKDSFTWDYLSGKGWISNAEVTRTLGDDLAAGNGEIPVDNVGCFLKLMGYEAVVPGKHDFYFGPERLRELARFLAQEQGRFHSVQMLAANLSIVTTEPDAFPRIPESQRKLRYETHFLDVKPDLPEVVLPWLRHFVIRNAVHLTPGVPQGTSAKLEDLRPDASATNQAAGLTHTDQVPSTAHPESTLQYDLARTFKAVFLCRAPRSYDDKAVSDPSDFPLPDSHDDACLQLHEDPPGQTPSRDVTFSLPLGKDLDADHNYGLCMELSAKQHGHAFYCAPFSVHSPFFQYHHAQSQQRITDPLPYALKRLGTRGDVVTVFGVVDPDLANQLGELNDAWLNAQSKYETIVEVTDPASALKQLLQTCELQAECKNSRKVLLAQMPAYKALQLLARLPGIFDLSIAQAEFEHETGAETIIKNLSAEDLARHGSTPNFVVIPGLTYDSQTDSTDLNVRVQVATVTPPQRCSSSMCAGEWRLDNTVLAQRIPQPDASTGTATLRQAAELTVKKEYEQIQHDAGLSWSPEETLQRVALMVMRGKYDGDIAFLQKRDLFEPLRYAAVPVDATNLQTLLDRVFWKNDFVIRQMVTGKTLKAMLDKSKQFDAEDRNALSADLQHGRALVQLGVFSDGETKALIVNGAPVEDAKLYSVVTTDYLGLGDTGYPELRVPAVPPAPRSKDFRTLHSLTSLLCQKIRESNAFLNSATCTPLSLDASMYLDESDHKPFDSTAGFTPLRRFISWIRPEHYPRPDLYASANALESAVQQRAVWSMSLDKLEIGYSLNEHNNGTEHNLAARFAGVPVAQVTAPDSNTLASGYRFGFRRSAQHVDAFGLSELAYTRQLTRQSNNAYLQDQKTNSLAFEAGINPRLWPSKKETPDLKGVVSLRLETQVADPITSFRLSDAAQSALRAPTERNRLLLAKQGIRFQDEKSWLEFGYEYGGNFNTAVAYRFNPGSPDEVTCGAAAGKGERSLAGCVNENSTEINGAAKITPVSTFAPITHDRLEHGLFLNFTLAVPLPIKGGFTYLMTNKGDVFFNRGDDVSLDTKYLDDWSHSLIIPIIGNFSFVPKADFYFYQNKVDNSRFHSLQTSLSLQYRFDWRPGLALSKALRYANPPSQSK